MDKYKNCVNCFVSVSERELIIHQASCVACIKNQVGNNSMF